MARGLGQGSIFKNTFSNNNIDSYNFTPWSGHAQPYPTPYEELGPEDYGYTWARGRWWRKPDIRTGLFEDQDVYLRTDSSGYSDFVDTYWGLNSYEPWAKLQVPYNETTGGPWVTATSETQDFIIPYQGSTGFGSIGFSGFLVRWTLDNCSWETGYNTVFTTRDSVHNVINLETLTEIDGFAGTDIWYRQLWNNTTLLTISQTMLCKEVGFFGDDVPYAMIYNAEFNPSGTLHYSPWQYDTKPWYLSTNTHGGFLGVGGESPVYLNMYQNKSSFNFRIKDAITSEIIYNYTPPISYQNHFASFAGNYISIPSSERAWYGGFFLLETKYGIKNGGWKVGSI